MPIVLVVAGIVFLLLPQGEDVARALAERRTNDFVSSQVVFFFAASLAWSLSAWYWARTMLLLKLPGVAGGNGLLQALRTWTPRVLGFVAALGLAAAFYKASRGYESEEYEEVKELLEFYAFWCAAGAVAFLVAASARRPIARAVYKLVKLEALNLPRAAEVAYGIRDLKDLGLLTRWLLFAAILASAGLFILMLLAVQSAAPVLGAAAIVLFAAAGWIAVACTLDYIGMRARFPVFSALLLMAVVFSLWNDNHAVRTLSDAQVAHRQNLRSSLRAWIVQHDTAIKNGTVPIFLVNAEGGGIRAAYWTATVLGELHNRHPRFASHVFAMSGVSGGSLGVSLFVALLNEQRTAEKPFDLKKRAQNILSEDFLSPVVGTLLFPDLAQRFLPVAVPAFDRAATLERSWEHAWARHVTGRNRMSEPFDLLWEGKEWTPALLLNATWVETGKRIIASNLSVAASRRREDFVDVEDAHAFFAPRSLPLSAATHMSARFTYVSPAGTLEKEGKVYGRVVDGGYFENSGATATLAILQTIEELANGDRRWQRVEPFVIHISNDPVEARYADDRLSSSLKNPNIRPKNLLNEALSPLWALLNTRNARGYYARESAAWAAGHWHYLHFGLCRGSTNAPLGWVLSASSRERMDKEVAAKPCAVEDSAPVFNNAENLVKMALLLGAPVDTKGPELSVTAPAPPKAGSTVRTSNE